LVLVFSVGLVIIYDTGGRIFIRIV
jgi:hypothetical protein